MNTNPGWYPGPTVAPGQRYHDGHRWTDRFTPAPPAAPTPMARPRADLTYARPRPVETIAIDVTSAGNGYRCIAVGETWSRSTVLAAPNPEVAALDIITELTDRDLAGRRICFVLNLTGGNPLRRHFGEIGSGTGDWWIERPDRRHRCLIAAAVALREELVSAQDFAPAIVAADGSVRGKHAGFGWLASTGDYGLAGYRSSTRRAGAEPVLVAELCAIGDAVTHLPGRLLTVLSDCRTAVAMANRWMNGEPVLPAGYPDDEPLHVFQHRIHADAGRLDIRWVKGHHGHPLNEGADALARLASRHRRGDQDVQGDEYARRAAGIAEAFAAEYARSVGTLDRSVDGTSLVV
ncbi:RNase H family protein [Mycolicibacterium bacteremicum]|uniref:RNase H family protein n=1 Tax=Mycolicibacterium bacteremicum TaxID=564198 RepID=UPI0026EA0259|nr:RNase H family protein [Mycolicibacterium bacteremicum]